MSKSITTVESDSDSVELKLGAKGDYTWTIKVYGHDFDEIQKKIDLHNRYLKENYGKKE